MKKVFNIDEGKSELWNNLVKRALKHSDKLTFNILYFDKELVLLVKKLGNIAHIENMQEKFYHTGDVLRLSLVSDSKKLDEALKDFNFWNNKFIEDPSFWIEKNEILASITHEDLVMIDMKYFGDIVSNIDLYNLPDSQGMSK